MRHRELEGLRCSPYLYAVNSLEVVVKDVYQNYNIKTLLTLLCPSVAYICCKDKGYGLLIAAFLVPGIVLAHCRVHYFCNGMEPETETMREMQIQCYGNAQGDRFLLLTKGVR